MALFKGFSDNVKDSFESNWDENKFGWYQGAGSVTLFTAGDPLVSASASGWTDAGAAGFDWFHVPGTTAPHRPITPSNSSSRPEPRGKYADSPNAFVGGLSDHGGDGAFGYHFEDMHSPSLAAALTCRKSYFLFDDVLVLLGSDITSTDPRYAVHTTLFQTALAASDPAPVLLNGSSHTAVPFHYREAGPGRAELRVRDPVGNGYVVQSTPDARLALWRREQVSVEADGEGSTSGRWALAVLDHGTPPYTKPKGYEYAILVNTTRSLSLSLSLSVCHSVLV